MNATMEPINTTMTSLTEDHLSHSSGFEMPTISPTTSNDASVASDEHLTTPPHSARQSFETVSPVRHHYIHEEPIIASGSYKPKYNFASLNKLKKASPPSPGGPKFDDEPAQTQAQAQAQTQAQTHTAPVPSPPASPSKKSITTTTPYTRPAGSMMISGLQRNPNVNNGGITALRPMTAANPNSKPSESLGAGRPQVHMPKSQPLSRTLFKNGQITKPTKPQKLIVPKKPFKTVFELPLTSSEFARRDWW